jgi:hypothetical protein
MPNGHAYNYAQPAAGYQAPYQTVNYPGYYYYPTSYYGR